MISNDGIEFRQLRFRLGIVCAIAVSILIHVLLLTASHYLLPRDPKITKGDLIVTINRSAEQNEFARSTQSPKNIKSESLLDESSQKNTSLETSSETTNSRAPWGRRGQISNFQKTPLSVQEARLLESSQLQRQIEISKSALASAENLIILRLSSLSLLDSCDVVIRADATFYGCVSKDDADKIKSILPAIPSFNNVPGFELDLVLRLRNGTIERIGYQDVAKSALYGNLKM